MIKGFSIFILEDRPSKILLRLNQDFFKHTSNLKNIELLCTVFDVHKAEVCFNRECINFLKDDGTVFYTLKCHKYPLLMTSNEGDSTNCKEFIGDITTHSKNYGYAHLFNREDFFEGLYNERAFEYLKCYSSGTYKITCTFAYNKEKDCLLVGSVSNEEILL